MPNTLLVIKTINTFPQLMPDLTGFITTQEAAKKLGYHINHVRRMIKRGDLDTKRVGHMLFVSNLSVESYQEKTKDFVKHDSHKRRKLINT